MSGALLAGMAMTTVGLIALLALALALVWVLVEYSRQQVRLAVAEASRDSRMDARSRPASVTRTEKTPRAA